MCSKAVANLDHFISLPFGNVPQLPSQSVVLLIPSTEHLSCSTHDLQTHTHTHQSTITHTMHIGQVAHMYTQPLLTIDT